MATVNKDFRVKHGLVVEGSTATVNGSNVLTEGSTEFLQDTTASMFTGGTSTGITFTYDDTAGVINAAVSSTPTFADKIIFEGANPDDYETTLQVTEPTQDNTLTLPNATDTLVGRATTDTLTNKTISGANNTLSNIPNNALSNSAITINGQSVSLGGSRTLGTDDVAEGATNKYFTDERAQDAIGLAIAAGTQSGITVSYDDADNAIDFSVADQFPTKTTSNLAEGTNLYFTDERAQDAVGDAINAGTQTGITVTYSDTSNKIDFAVADQFATKSTTNLAEGTNLYFTDERAVDAVATAIANGTQTNITITYNDEANSLSFNATGGVASLTGTANEVEVTNVGSAYTVGLPNDITIAGNITINGTPTQATHAATKGYVDSVAEGLHVHASVVAATTANVDLSTALENGDVVDGVTLATGDRVLVKAQTAPAQNGIYVVQASGAAVRATDYDSAAEIDPGDFVFVTGGTLYDNTGWVQVNTVTTLGTDPIEWIQFSGAGTYTAGNGLTLTGTSFSINTGVTVDLNTPQTLTNKTLTSPVLTTPSITGMLVLDNNIVIEGTDDVHETTLTFTDPTADRTITFKDETGTVAFTADIETAIDGFGNAVVAGTGISTSYNATTNALTIGNTGVTSLSGTTNQVNVSGSTGSVTLSLPQSIATTSSPTFAGVTVGQVTFADALTGTAIANITDTNATVVDSWSPAAYRSGKYVVQMRNGNDIEVLEVLVTVDGNNNVYLTEYADVISNAALGTTDADYSAGNVRLLVTSTSGTTVKVHKTLIEA